MHTIGLRDIFILIRFPVTLAVTFTAFATMVLKTGEATLESAWVTAGIFLLAAGASAFNQYQEWPWDEKMERTRRRPIPARRVSPAEGVRIAMICIAGGLIILMYHANWICFLLGIFNLIWYNGLYTWLKRKTAFAVVPGALTGAVPVLMGWTAFGGDLLDPFVLFLAFFIFLWQMPHFWMMMLRYGPQYQQAGFRVLPDLFSDRQIRRIVLFWVLAASAVSVMFAHFGMVTLKPVIYVLLSLNGILILILTYHLFLTKRPNFKMMVMSANIYIFILLLLMIVDKLAEP